VQDILQFYAQLADDLLALLLVFLGGVAGELLAGTADGEALLIQEAADLADHQHVVALIIASVAAPLDRFELGKLLLPVAQDMGFHLAQLADLADGEVALSRYRGKFRKITAARIQHTPLPVL